MNKNDKISIQYFFDEIWPKTIDYINSQPTLDIKSLPPKQRQHFEKLYDIQNKINDNKRLLSEYSNYVQNKMNSPIQFNKDYTEVKVKTNKTPDELIIDNFEELSNAANFAIIFIKGIAPFWQKRYKKAEVIIGSLAYFNEYNKKDVLNLSF